MTRPRLGHLTALIVFAALAIQVTPAAAAMTKYIRATNTSTASGNCGIIIESFGLVARKGPEASDVMSFNINVPIPAFSTATNTASLIQAALASGLPGDYTATIVPASPTFVQIVRGTGTFTMAITENVPTQVIEEDNPTVPFLGGPEQAWLGLCLALAGVWYMRSRRREADSSS